LVDPSTIGETSIFPKEFDKVAQKCYMEQMDAFSKLFEDEQFYKRVMSEMAKAMYLNYRNSELGETKKLKTQEVQLIPQGSMLDDVEKDADVRRLVHNHEKYFSMKGNDWRHLIRDYVRKVTERPELQEAEVFRYVMAG